MMLEGDNITLAEGAYVCAFICIVGAVFMLGGALFTLELIFLSY